MRRVTFVTIFVFLFSFSAVLFGQGGTYEVQKGDTLWWLSGVKLGNPTQWRQVISQNPFLNEPGRQIQRGNRFIVVIKPGEHLAGLEELGILPNPMPVSEISQPTPAPIPAPVKAEEFWSLGMLLALGMLLWALLAAVVVYYFYVHRPQLRRRQEEQERAKAANRRASASATASAATATSTTATTTPTAAPVTTPTATQVEPVRNPATAGVPFVQSGIKNATEADIIARIVAQQIHKERHHQELHRSCFTVLDRTRGTGFGRMMTQYKDGRELDSILNGEVVWRMNVEFPDGVREDVFALQECANPLRTGDVSRYQPGEGFRFVPDEPAQTIPAPVPAATTPTSVGPVRPRIVAVNTATGERMSVLVEANRLTVLKGEDPFMIVYGDFTLRNQEGVATLTHPILGELRLELEMRPQAVAASEY